MVCRTMCKTLVAQTLPTLEYEADAMVPIEHVKPSLHMTTYVDTMVHKARKEGITQPQETKK